MNPLLPRLFGGRARNQILVALAVNGPQTRRALARAASVDPQQTLDIVRALADIGAVTHYPGERKDIELDPHFFVAAELREVLLRIAGTPARRRQEIAEPVLPRPGMFDLFGKQSRLLVLTALVKERSAKPIAEIAASTGLTLNAVTNAINYLERDEIVVSSVVRHVREAQLNADFIAAAALRDMLVKIAIFEALAPLSRCEPEAITKNRNRHK